MNDEVKLHGTTDASVWATEFCKRWPSALCQIPGKEGVSDESDFKATMIGWFANAIMTGVDSVATQQFNGLTPAEAERLAMLAEEAAEVNQIAMKILRHGYESFHPDDPQRFTNRRLLEKELLDLFAVHLAMIRSGDIRSPGDLETSAQEQWEKKLRYTHHQEKTC